MGTGQATWVEEEKPMDRVTVTEAYGRVVVNAFGGHEAKLSIPAQEDDDDLLVGRALRDLFDDRDAKDILLGRCREFLEEGTFFSSTSEKLLDALAKS